MVLIIYQFGRLRRMRLNVMMIMLIGSSYLFGTNGFHGIHNLNNVATRYVNHNHDHHKRYHHNKANLYALNGFEDIYHSVIDKLSSSELLSDLKISYSIASSNIFESLNSVNVIIDSLVNTQGIRLMEIINTYLTNNNNNILSLLTTDTIKDYVNMISTTELSMYLPIITIMITTMFVINGNSDIDSTVGSPYDDGNYQYDQATSDRFYSNKR